MCCCCGEITVDDYETTVGWMCRGCYETWKAEQEADTKMRCQLSESGFICYLDE